MNVLKMLKFRVYEKRFTSTFGYLIIYVFWTDIFLNKGKFFLMVQFAKNFMSKGL